MTILALVSFGQISCDGSGSSGSSDDDAGVQEDCAICDDTSTCVDALGAGWVCIDDCCVEADTDDDDNDDDFLDDDILDDDAADDDVVDDDAADDDAVDDDVADDDVVDDDLDDDDTQPTTTTTTFTPVTTTTTHIGPTTTTTHPPATTTTTIPLHSGEMRIELFWGLNPVDLDIHMWAANDGCEETNPYHLYYATNGIGTNGCIDDFDLTLDDVSGFGPEIIEIYHPVENQDYHVLVHDYTNITCGSNCVAMSNSVGLRVRVTTEDGSVIYTMPTQTSATLWDVFTASYDGLSWRFSPVNAYCLESDPTQVESCL